MAKVSNKQKLELAKRKKLKRLLLAEGPRDEAGNPLCWHCETRGDWRGLAMHHVAYLSRGGETLIDNNILVCYTCHSKIHGIEEVK